MVRSTQWKKDGSVLTRPVLPVQILPKSPHGKLRLKEMQPLPEEPIFRQVDECSTKKAAKIGDLFRQIPIKIRFSTNC
jgi:hypothetical protein